MSRKNILSGFSSEIFTVRAVALVPVIVLCFFVIAQFKSRPALEAVHRDGAGGPGEAALSTGLRDWGGLNWEEKGRRVSAAIRYFREKSNCAILRSAESYVVLVDRLLQEDPSAQNKTLLTVLRVLAVREYDFYSGINAVEQALSFLGPELFLKNQEAQKAEEARLRPVDVKT